MSKAEIPGQPIVELRPREQLKSFADLLRARVNPKSHERLAARTREFGLTFAEEELFILSALDTPERVQQFLNTQIYYNDDHAFPGQEETAMSPRQVLQSSRAHCFEGAMFAYAVNFLHGHAPRHVLLEASQDSEHNLVLYQDPKTGMYGVNAHSAFPHLDGRPPNYTTVRAIAESYYPFYYSDRTRNPSDLTLVGYSDPFDLIGKYGVEWIAWEKPLWDIYYTYIDDTITFHYLFEDSDETHLYPLIRALKEGWIKIEIGNQPSVSVEGLAQRAQELWKAFWREFDSRNARPQGAAREIEKQFQKLTATTPLDLIENAEELRKFLERGYRVEQLLTRG